MTDREKDVAVMKEIIGRDADYIKNAWLQFASAYGWDGAWCSETACSVSYLAGNVGKIPVSNYAEGLVKEFKKAGKFGSTPHPGDFIFFASNKTPDHTGRVIAVEGNNVITCEGNISGRVVRRIWPKSIYYIYGYGYPDFDDIEEETDMTKTEAAILVAVRNIELRRVSEDWPAENNPAGLVNFLENYLYDKGYYKGTLNDGDFGSYLEASVKSWQKDNGLYADGWIGANSWAKIMQG